MTRGNFGDMVQGLDIPAKSGGWVAAKRGDFIRIVDVEGAQIADAFAVSATDKGEWLSAGNTRSATARLFPEVGQAFMTNKGQPILTFVEDASPGIHDMLFRSCDRFMYEFVGAPGGHSNCADHFMRAASEVGWSPADVPDPVNFFQNTPVNAEGAFEIGTAQSKAGDAVVLQAEMDLILVVTACSWDIQPINGDSCTGLRIEVSGPGSYS